MNGTYDVCLKSARVGNVKITTSGLYCFLESECHWLGEKMMHLIMMTEDGSLDLGLMTPDNGKLRITKKIPNKRIGKEIRGFHLRERSQETEEFCAIDPDVPFPYLHRLDEAKLSVRDGKTGLIFLKKTAEKD